ncbi:MAG TPA: heavy metal translocating P-type ATPase metal-binding domain-containing protein [Aliidongia sp.]|nr:heavy metal translocating P-type ATPase metal-binding domain-containing protein [Aliidongia sp.]
MSLSPASVPPAALCAHCGLPAPAGARFCCSGCAAAFEIIQGLGLERYYRQRVLDPAARAPKPEEGAGFDFDRYVRLSGDGIAELVLMVDGIQCGACVWLIESILAKIPGIVDARVNMTTRRLRLRWRPSEVTAAALVHAVEQLGYRLVPFDAVSSQAGDDRTGRALVKALAVAGFAAGNLMLLSIGIWVGFSQGMGEATRALLHWASAIIALPAIAFAGWPFFRSALSALRHGRTNMDVPISLGVLLVTGVSLAETIRGGPHTYFDSAAMLLFFLLIGRLLDHRARGKAREAAEQLIGLRVLDVAVLRADGTVERRAQERVAVGERVLVGMGERVGIDGVVESGSSTLDTSIVTGESVPVPAGPGTKLFAGSINLGNPLVIAVSAAGEGTLLAECVRLIEAAEQGRGRFVRLADRVARYYAPVVHLAALGTFLTWWLILGVSWTAAILDAAAVLIITCPCALALAVPAVQVIATGRLFRAGILLKSATALERLASVDTIIFDKTGTLTEPALALVPDPACTSGDLEEAASLAVASRHPLARALVAAAPRVRPAEGVEEKPGAGLRRVTPVGEIRLGSRAFCGIVVGPLATGPELWLQRPGKPALRFVFAERPREDAAETIALLKRRGYEIELFSGDRPEPVQSVAGQVGIGPYAAGMSPVDKAAELAVLEAEGRHVLMVGDGLNDGPALAAASVSMSPATAADLSQTVADLVFQGSRLGPVATALAAARAARRLIRQNIALSIGYNLVMVPLAMLGWVTPWLAAAAMSGSSLLVILNSLRFRESGK